MGRVARLVWVSVVVGALLAPAVSAEGVSDDGRVLPVLGADFRISDRNATSGESNPAAA